MCGLTFYVLPSLLRLAALTNASKKREISLVLRIELKGKEIYLVFDAKEKETIFLRIKEIKLITLNVKK